MREKLTKFAQELAVLFSIGNSANGQQGLRKQSFMTHHFRKSCGFQNRFFQRYTLALNKLVVKIPINNLQLLFNVHNVHKNAHNEGKQEMNRKFVIALKLPVLSEEEFK
jgi:hypothetical protein